LRIYRVWERANGKANRKYGAPIVNVYNALKHSWDGNGLERGFLLDQVSVVMGHVTVEMTKRYAQYRLEKMKDVIRGKHAGDHRLFTPTSRAKILELKPIMVCGTGAE